MPKRQIFYSFHYLPDAWRVQQIRHMHVIDGNASVSPNEWEAVKAKGSAGIEKWIDNAMSSRSCVIVLIGAETAGRKWIKYEIEKAWNSKNKGLFGIYIHNLGDSTGKTVSKGKNPFAEYSFANSKGEKVSIATYDPPANNVINTIKSDIDSWIEKAIAQR